MEWVLIVVLTVGMSGGGVTTLTQTFNTLERCETARVAVARYSGEGYSVRMHGCFQR